MGGPASVLRHRNFRLFWIGALISNTGTWLQTAAVPYVLFKLTHSSTWVGLSVFVSLIPGVIFGPIGGGIADRVDRRWMLFWIQAGAAITALVMAALWVAHYRSPGVLLALCGVSGVFMGFSMPAWQGFIADLVPRRDLPAAIILNSVQFHGSRAIGPALAGLILATVGPTWAFVGNGLSFISVLIALWFVRTTCATKPPSGETFLGQVRAGMAYTRNHTPIATAMLLVMACGFLGNPIVQLAPEFSDRVYHVGAGKYGLLSGAFGLGAGLGVYAVGHLTQTRSRSSVLLGLFMMLGLAVLGFGLSPNFPAGLVCLLFAGSAAIGMGVLLLTSVQAKVDDAFRGRVLGVYGMAFTGSYPLGALAQGALAERIGARQNEFVVAGAVLLVTGALFLNRPRVETINSTRHLQPA